jgi:hypothetical protein
LTPPAHVPVAIVVVSHTPSAVSADLVMLVRDAPLQPPCHSFPAPQPVGITVEQ